MLQSTANSSWHHKMLYGVRFPVALPEFFPFLRTSVSGFFSLTGVLKWFDWNSMCWPYIYLAQIYNEIFTKLISRGLWISLSIFLYFPFESSFLSTLIRYISFITAFSFLSFVAISYTLLAFLSFTALCLFLPLSAHLISFHFSLLSYFLSCFSSFLSWSVYHFLSLNFAFLHCFFFFHLYMFTFTLFVSFNFFSSCKPLLLTF